MKPSYRFYRRCYRIAYAILCIFFWFDVKGRENMPEGAAMICANHSSNTDPVFIALAVGIDYFVHFIAKVELFSKPVLSTVIIKLGAISIDREMLGVATIKNILEYFKLGEKVGIFPEGTRASKADYVAAKSGAVKIAERANVPVVPIYLPRKKLMFRKFPVVIGEPYFIEKQSAKRSPEDYAQLAGVLMSKIEALNPGNQTA